MSTTTYRLAEHCKWSINGNDGGKGPHRYVEIYTDFNDGKGPQHESTLELPESEAERLVQRMSA